VLDREVASSVHDQGLDGHVRNRVVRAEQQTAHAAG
jgi:hypothetical protein